MSTVAELSPRIRTRPSRARSRPTTWQRYERYLGEILTALGMDPRHAGHPRHPAPAPAGALRCDRRATTATPSSTRRSRPSGRTASPAPAARSSRGRSPSTRSASTTRCRSTASRTSPTSPDREILGISKLTRLVRLYARRFTVQERLGEQIADTLVELVEPRGVAVHLEAAHLCTQMRGVAEESSRTVTTFWRGLYDEDADLRREFLDEVRGRALNPLALLDERPGLPELDLPDELRRLYGGGLGFERAVPVRELRADDRRRRRDPGPPALERADRGRERGRPLRDGAAARLRRRRARRLRDDARLAAGNVAPERVYPPAPRSSPSCGAGSGSPSGRRRRSSPAAARSTHRTRCSRTARSC